MLFQVMGFKFKNFKKCFCDVINLELYCCIIIISYHIVALSIEAI